MRLIQHWFVCVEPQAPQKNGLHVMNNIISFRVILCGGFSPQPPSTHNVTFVQCMAKNLDVIKTRVVIPPIPVEYESFSVADIVENRRKGWLFVQENNIVLYL